MNTNKVSRASQVIRLLALCGIVSYLIILPAPSGSTGLMSPEQPDAAAMRGKKSEVAPVRSDIRDQLFPTGGVLESAKGNMARVGDRQLIAGIVNGRRLDSLRYSLALQATPTVTATKAGVLAMDDGDGNPEPGEQIMYTVTISNTGSAAATGVMFTDTIDANTTLVAGSVAASPIAVNDAYQTIGNVDIQVPAAQGLLANDSNPNGSGTLTITGNTNCVRVRLKWHAIRTPREERSTPEKSQVRKGSLLPPRSFTLKLNVTISFEYE